MKQIKVIDIIQTAYPALDDGQKVYEDIHPLLQQGQAVELDFAGINLTISVFYNFAIGQLVKDCDMSKLTIVGLTPQQQVFVDGVIENAKNYYQRRSH